VQLHLLQRLLVFGLLLNLLQAPWSYPQLLLLHLFALQRQLV